MELPFAEFILNKWSIYRVLVAHTVIKLIILTNDSIKMEYLHGMVICAAISVFSLVFSIPSIWYYQQWYAASLSTDPSCDVGICEWLYKFSRIYRRTDNSPFDVGIPMFTFGVLLILNVVLVICLLNSSRVQNARTEKQLGKWWLR